MTNSVRFNAACFAQPKSCVFFILITLSILEIHPANALINDKIMRNQAEQIVTLARSKITKMGAGEDLAVSSVLTTRQGRTVVHANQTYQGHRVWGSVAIIHSEANGNSGTPHIAAQNLSTAPVPKNPPILTQNQATAIAMKAMANQGPAAIPKTELVVFPTKHHGGIATVFDPVTRKYVVDYSKSVISLVPKDAYVWAYEVHGFAKNSIDKIKDMIYIVDARTGAIIHIESGLHTLAPMNPPTQYPTDVPAVGVGNSQYSGTVAIGTTMHADGTFGLIDTTRGNQPNPYLAYSFLDPDTGQPVYDANGNPISALGLETATQTHDSSGDISLWWFDEYPTNVWGDSNQFVMYPFGGEATTNGQTAAVDAQYGMAATWDFYQNIFGMNGIDGQGSSPLAIVHELAPNGYYGAYAAWSEFGFQLVISDGDKYPGPDDNGNPTPYNPAGHSTMSAVDIIAHELTHSVVNNTAALTYANESGELDEGTADIFGQMIEAYSKRPSGADNLIPATGNDWLVGSQTGTPFRNLMQPSSDGIAADNWYDGIQFLDLHSGSGPLTRWFYFLTQGASATVGSSSYSAYLPGGMTGIGNDHAARIWFQALSNYLTPDSAYADARVAAVSAATDLYGAGSPDVAAVKSAFAAINVGGPTDTPRITITMPVVQGPNSPFLGQTYISNTGTDLIDRIPFVAMTTSVQLQATVQNTSNTAVVWTVGGLADDIYAMGGTGGYGGVINADGSWTPNNIWGFHSMTATSVADPLQYAEGSVWVVNGDADSDNEFDAIDLGSVALSWGLNASVKSTHSLMNSGFTNSYDVAAIVEAFINAFGGI